MLHTTDVQASTCDYSLNNCYNIYFSLER